MWRTGCSSLGQASVVEILARCFLPSEVIKKESLCLQEQLRNLYTQDQSCTKVMVNSVHDNDIIDDCLGVDRIQGLN